MAQPEYPTEIAVQAFRGGDLTAISNQLLTVCTHYPERAREFAYDVAVAVGSTECHHTEPPPVLDTNGEDSARGGGEKPRWNVREVPGGPLKCAVGVLVV